jgi:hypothetical protein
LKYLEQFMESYDLKTGWTKCSDKLPECGDRYSASSGWSPWLACIDDDRDTDDGIVVFTASYSSVMKCWHLIGNQKVKVTRYRPLPKRSDLVDQPIGDVSAVSRPGLAMKHH